MKVLVVVDNVLSVCIVLDEVFTHGRCVPRVSRAHPTLTTTTNAVTHVTVSLRGISGRAPLVPVLLYASEFAGHPVVLDLVHHTTPDIWMCQS